MQDHQCIPVKAIKEVFWNDRSYSPGDEFLMSEERAVREGLAGLIEYDFNVLTNRAKSYFRKLTNPTVPSEIVVY
jgi:hypothetical protein